MRGDRLFRLGFPLFFAPFVARQVFGVRVCVCVFSVRCYAVYLFRVTYVVTALRYTLLHPFEDHDVRSILSSDVQSYNCRLVAGCYMLVALLLVALLLYLHCQH